MVISSMIDMSIFITTPQMMIMYVTCSGCLQELAHMSNNLISILLTLYISDKNYSDTDSDSDLYIQV